MSLVLPITQRYPTNSATRKTPSAMFTSTPLASTRCSAHANSVVGPRMKIAMKATSAIVSDTPIWRLESCSSSAAAWFDAIISARMPIESD